MQFQSTINSLDNNDGYKYYLQIEDYYSVSSNSSDYEIEGIIDICNQIQKICEDNNSTIYYQAEYVTNYNLLKKYLAEDYVNELKKTASGAVELTNSSEYINEDITIMGYSKEMIKALADIENQQLKKINDDEAFVLNRTTNKDENGGKKLLSMLGEKCEFETLVYDEKLQDWKKTSYNIVGEVSDLLVYPQYSKNSLCLIIDIDQYNKWFNNNYVPSFYLNDIDSAVLDKIQHIVEGNSHIKIIDIEDNALNVKAGYYGKLLLMVLVLIMCCIFVVVNIQVQNIFEFDYRQSEFELLRIIGISPRKNYAIIALESSYVFVLGLSIGGVLCKTLEIYFYNMCIINKNNMSLQFIVESVVIVIIFMVLSIYLTCNKVKKGFEYET